MAPTLTMRARLAHKLFLSVAAVLILTLATAAAVAATASTLAAGTYTATTYSWTPSGTAGCNTFYREDATPLYAGDLDWATIAWDEGVLHCDGSHTALGTEVCAVCTLAGRTGGFTAVFTIKGHGFDYTGSYIVTKGTGGLAGLRLQGTFAGSANGSTYSYNYHFRP